MFWIRPDLAHLPALGKLARAGKWLDAALFDIDGVLIDTSASYRRSVIAATERLTRLILGEPLDTSALPDTSRVTTADVIHFKLAGGFNNDWYLTQALTALCVARAREWRGQPEAACTLAEWAALAAEATHQGRGGVVWLHATVPASAIPDLGVARWAHDECYWGADLVRDLYGHTPLYAPAAPGVVQNERMLLEPALLPALRVQGIRHFGVITGRIPPEVAYVLRRLTAASGLLEDELVSASDVQVERIIDVAGGAVGGVDAMAPPPAFGRSPFSLILTGVHYSKPNPLALAHALRDLNAWAALYSGDTTDDLDLVLRYRAMEVNTANTTKTASIGAWGIPTLAVMVASDATAPTFEQRGADVILPHVRELPAALAALRDQVIAR
ncbi:MAG: hypothetical protein ABI068_06280 [Ktedonobacterales bacterium]